MRGFVAGNLAEIVHRCGASSDRRKHAGILSEPGDCGVKAAENGLTVCPSYLLANTIRKLTGSPFLAHDRDGASWQEAGLLSCAPECDPRAPRTTRSALWRDWITLNTWTAADLQAAVRDRIEVDIFCGIPGADAQRRVKLPASKPVRRFDRGPRLAPDIPHHQSLASPAGTSFPSTSPRPAETRDCRITTPRRSILAFERGMSSGSHDSGGAINPFCARRPGDRAAIASLVPGSPVLAPPPQSMG